MKNNKRSGGKKVFCVPAPWEDVKVWWGAICVLFYLLSPCIVVSGSLRFLCVHAASDVQLLIFYLNFRPASLSEFHAALLLLLFDYHRCVCVYARCLMPDSGDGLFMGRAALIPRKRFKTN
jgi:hypothetical protein